MSIAISYDLCVGCGRCITVCPGTLISQKEDKKAYMKYPKDCWGCCSCIKECPKKAISLYLGADIGGRGSLMTVNKEDGILHWSIKETNGVVHKIDINSRDSNKY